MGARARYISNRFFTAKVKASDGYRLLLYTNVGHRTKDVSVGGLLDAYQKSRDQYQGCYKFYMINKNLYTNN